MARKSTKSNPTNAAEAMEMIMATEPLKTVSEAAEFVGVAEIRILELFSDALSLPEAMGWEVIPQEHEHLLNEFKAQAQNIQALPETTEPAVEPPIEQPTEQAQEPPMLEEEPQPEKKKRGRKPSTALTKKKAEALKTSDQKSQQLAASDQEVKVRLHARKGQKSGAQLATIELAAEDLTYRKVKGEALLRKTGQLISEISGSADIDPVQVLSELGLDTNDEIFDALRTQIEPALGKIDSTTAEIVESAWVNGIDLEAELGNLESLLNSNEFTSDCWQ